MKGVKVAVDELQQEELTPKKVGLRLTNQVPKGLDLVLQHLRLVCDVIKSQTQGWWER